MTTDKGVRISWETERSRLARIFSFSLSARSRSCCLAWLVRVLVMMDDISLPVGVIRLRRKGSDGGQKGMRSIITLSGSDQFPRIKLGVGAKPHPDYDLAAWVLSRFTKEEAPGMVQAAHHAAEAAELIVQGRMEEAMNRYSG